MFITSTHLALIIIIFTSTAPIERRPLDGRRRRNKQKNEENRGRPMYVKTEF